MFKVFVVPFLFMGYGVNFLFMLLNTTNQTHLEESFDRRQGFGKLLIKQLLFNHLLILVFHDLKSLRSFAKASSSLMPFRKISRIRLMADGSALISFTKLFPAHRLRILFLRAELLEKASIFPPEFFVFLFRFFS